MNKVARKLMHWFYRPLLSKYLQKDRAFHYDGLKLLIKKGVFHPAFFGSSLVFYNFLKGQALTEKRLLEIGCGSGLLSLASSRHNAQVTAIDINPIAVECTYLNAQENGLALEVFESNLFSQIEKQAFDLIILNPPFFEGIPRSASAHAWYTGEEHQFYHTFFQGLQDYIHHHSQVWMILSEVCELERIKEIASKHQFKMQSIFQRQRQFEQFIIFELKSHTN